MLLMSLSVLTHGTDMFHFDIKQNRLQEASMGKTTERALNPYYELHSPWKADKFKPKTS